jgi:protein-S-isoprenylcysteine O-methyltransferase Ste14
MGSQVTIDPFYWIVFWFVVVSWFVFAAAFVIRKRPEKAKGSVRNNKSIWSIMLTGVGMALVWWVRRPVGSAIVPGSLEASYVLDLVACIIALASIGLVLAAIRSLGKQWNVRAMLVDQHALVTTGPYAIVRHPIYTGMLGLMIATGLVNSYWYVVVAAIVVAFVGTGVRIRQEEQLLREQFGAEFEAYQQTVPAFLPWFPSRR